MTRIKTKERDRRPSEVRMEIFRVFRTEDIRSEELVEILFNILRESRESLTGGARLSLAIQQGADLLSEAA
jgi:hypothetical protein